MKKTYQSPKILTTPPAPIQSRQYTIEDPAASFGEYEVLAQAEYEVLAQAEYARLIGSKYLRTAPRTVRLSRYSIWYLRVSCQLQCFLKLLYHGIKGRFCLASHKPVISGGIMLAKLALEASHGLLARIMKQWIGVFSTDAMRSVSVAYHR